MAGGHEKYRVLIVDDSTDETATLTILLGKAGYKIEYLNDSRRAIERLRAFRPQAVLLDIAMPHLDGFQVAELIRQEPGFEKVVLVAITGFDSDENFQRAAQAKIDHYLVKPIKLAQIRKILAAPS
jgi:CheY-like chemotaxis protein